MMKMQNQTQEIPYVRTDGKLKKASVIPINFSLEGLTNEEIQVFYIK